MAQLTLSPRSRAVGAPVLAVAGGVLTGGFAAWAYYDDTFRPLAHTFGLWITVLALVSARRPVRDAVLRSVLALGSAVLAFYVGKKVVYDQLYSPPLPWPREELQEWLVLAVVVGCLLGAAFSRIGRPGRAGAVATAAFLGLLAGDAFRRVAGYGSSESVVVVVALLGAAAVLVTAVRSRRQLAEIALWVVPMAALGLLLVSLPDVLEQLLITAGR
jgi:hypothetical protein